MENIAEKLSEYKKLLDNGVISQEEFDALKKKAIDNEIKDEQKVQNPVNEKVVEYRPIPTKEQNGNIVKRRVAGIMFAVLATLLILLLPVPLCVSGGRVLSTSTLMGSDNTILHWYMMDSGSSFHFVKVIGLLLGVFILVIGIPCVGIGIATIAAPRIKVFTKLVKIFSFIMLALATLILILGVVVTIVVAANNNPCYTLIEIEYIPIVAAGIVCLVFAFKAK